jgi:hypothetical protein
MLYCLLSKERHNLLLPFSMAIIAILTVTGPWSAYFVSKLDQNRRFITILKKYDMIDANQIVKPCHPISVKEKVQIVSILEYFQSSHSLRELRPLPANFKLSQTSQVFGFKITKDDHLSRYDESYFCYDVNDQANQLLKIQEFDYCLNNLKNDTIQTRPDQKLEIIYNSGPKDLKITFRGHAIYQQKIISLIIPAFKKRIPSAKQAVTYWDENEHLKVFYVFHTISEAKDHATNEIKFYNLIFTIYIQLKPSSL